MAVLAFDIGGSAVKYGIWTQENLVEKNKFKTPKTWDEMKATLVGLKETFSKDYELEGIAISSPGSVNQEGRQVEGTSAVPYLHFFPIYDELEAAFGLPIAMENDANSAALAEVWKGAARESDTVLFVVIGTGIGGSVIVDKKVHHGKHLFGGEFGYMLLEGTKSFSQLATPVNMALRYTERKGLSSDAVDGQEVFALAKAGDAIAKEEVDTFFKYLTIGLYNLAYAFDPEKVLIGGGVSNMDGILERIEEEFERLFNRMNQHLFVPELELCVFRNDANLIGAVYNYLQKHTGLE